MRTILLMMAFALPLRAEDPIGPPPKELVEKLKLSPFYRKYLDCKGLPILASNGVSDAALREAADIVEHMLEGRDDIRRAIVDSGVRLAVMSPSETTTDIPEHSDLKPKEYWDKRARGLGATKSRPAVSCAEENLLNLKGDRYARENILVHEFGHVIHEMGLNAVDPKFDGRLAAAYSAAKEKGLWKGTYAMENRKEYWAEGVQSYFDCNDRNNASHNDVDTREKLRKYDPVLFELLDGEFKQSKWTYVRYDKRTGAQTPPSAPAEKPAEKAKSPEALPGNGLMEHDFLYAGEAKDRRVFIVRKGKVVWTYDDPQGKGEISDAVMLSSGNVLIAHQYAVKLVSPEKKVLWERAAPKGTEIHTAVPVGLEHVLYVQNGVPATAKLVNIASGETKVEFELPTKGKGVHGQFRHARLNADGKLLVSHMDSGKVCEYDDRGRAVWSLDVPGIWGAEPLKNGNVLVTSRAGVAEITHAGETVFKIAPADLPDYRLANLQLAWRLPNGNTVFNNWVNAWSNPADLERGDSVQALEITPDKKVAWALRSWKDPNLGPATTLQFLDGAGKPEDVSFGGIK